MSEKPEEKRRPRIQLPIVNEKGEQEIDRDLRAIYNRVVNHPVKAAFKGLGIGYIIPDAINTVGLIAISPTAIGLSALFGLAVGTVIAFTVYKKVSSKKKASHDVSETPPADPAAAATQEDTAAEPPAPPTASPKAAAAAPSPQKAAKAAPAA